MQDSFFRGFCVFFVVLNGLYILLSASPHALEILAENADHLLFPLVAWAFFRPSSSVATRVEKRFWRLLGSAWLIWWCCSWVQQLWPQIHGSPSFGLINDGLFVLYYLAWLAGIGLQPHLVSNARHSQAIRRLRSVGTLGLVLILVVYFLMVPNRSAGTVDFDPWAPSLFLFFLLDLLLLMRLGRAAQEAEGHRWRSIYGGLAFGQLIFAALDLIEGLIYAGWMSWPFGLWSDSLWNMPFFLMVVGAIFKQMPADERKQSGGKDKLEDDTFAGWDLGRCSPITCAAFLLPFVHIGAYRLGVLAEPFRQSREIVVLAGLAVLFALGRLESRQLKRSLKRVAEDQRELQELRLAQELAHRADSTRNRFLANISHEIRTPMNGILGIADMLLKSSLGSDDHRRVELLRSSGRGLLQIIDDILDYTKIQAEGPSIQQRRFALVELIEDVTDLQRQTVEAGDTEIRLEVEEDLPSHWVTDPFRLRQVLTNLIANGLKFTEGGTLTVRVSREVESENEELRFEVQDTGVGIADEHLAGLFDPFVQVDPSRSRRFGGVGLGLAICRQIVEHQGGRIGAVSRAGEGSTFWFVLPMFATRPPSRPPAQGPDLKLANEPKILLAEDNLINQMVTMNQLQDLGAEVHLANDGAEAVTAYQEQNYDLILMDCQMPGVDGYEATRRLRRLEEASEQRTPIIALTAHALTEDRKRCLQAGMDDYLAKPYTLEEMAKLLDHWLRPPDERVVDDSWVMEEEEES